jgi:hypothetical protein
MFTLLFAEMKKIRKRKNVSSKKMSVGRTFFGRWISASAEKLNTGIGKHDHVLERNCG